MKLSEQPKHNASTKKLLLKATELVSTGIIFAVVASLLTTAIIDANRQQAIVKGQLDAISNIYIGCNKSWIDQGLGNPQFIATKDELLLCAYVSEYYVIQVAFDDAFSTKAYLITTLENEDNIHITINNQTIASGEARILGSFAYDEFDVGELIEVWGFISNGNTRALYAENFWTNGGGNYYSYHLASYDFGKLGCTFAEFLQSFGMGDEITDGRLSINSGFQIIKDRHTAYPNTYGVSSSDINVAEIFYTYDWFNSMQLRNKTNQSVIDWYDSW